MATVRLVVALIAGAAGLCALSNTRTVYNASGADQTNMPYSLGMYFAKGDIPAACAKPYIGGVAATVWQCDRWNAWDDGSLRFATISFQMPFVAANGSVDVDFRPSNFASSGSGVSFATLASIDWGAQIDYTFNKGSSNEFSGSVNAKTMLSALTQSDCSVRKTLDGAVVTEFLIEDRCAGDSFDFGAKWDNTSGYWVTAPSIDYKSLHPIFQVRVYQNYPSTGQYAVWVREILENPWVGRRQNQVLSFSFKTGVSLSTVLDAQDNFTIIHGQRIPWEGPANGVSLPLAFDDPNLAYMVYAKSIPAYETESITPSGPVVGLGGVDEEVNQSGSQSAYGIKALLTGTVNGVTIQDAPQYSRATTSPAHCASGSQCAGQWTKAMTAAGGRGDLAPLPRWYMKWLYVVRNPSLPVAKKLEYWQWPLWGNALAVTSAPVHYRDSDTGYGFCPDCSSTSAQTADIHGRIFSIDATPNQAKTLMLSSYSNDTSNLGTLAYTRAPGCALGQPCWPSYNNWSVQTANDYTHYPSMAYFPALISGDWFWIEENLLWGQQDLMGLATGSSYSRTRHDSWGYLSQGAGGFTRSQAWHIRNRAQILALMPDTWTPEKEYVDWINQKTIEVEEGYLGLTTADGAYYYNPAPGCAKPCMTSPWQWGWDTVRTTEYGGVQRPVLDNPLRFYPREDSAGAQFANPNTYFDTSKTYAISVPWMEGYTQTSMGYAIDLGIPQWTTLAKYVANPTIQILRNPIMNPFASVAYQWPIGKQAFPRHAITNIVKTSSSVLQVTTADAHGLVTGNQVGLCCGSPASTWQPVGNTIWSVTVIDDYNFTVSSSGFSTISGSYPGGMYATKTSSTDMVIGNGGYFTTWADWWDAFDPNYRLNPSFIVGAMQDKNGGYPLNVAARIAAAADIGATSDSYTAWGAYQWTRSNVGWQKFAFANDATCAYTVPYCQNPLWSIAPRPQIENLQVTPASNSVIFRFTAPTGDTPKIYFATTAPGSSLDDSDTAVACNGRSCMAVLAANPSAAYYYRITAGALGGTARKSGTVTTPAAGGTTALKLKLNPPPGLAVNTVLVEYGATSSYGSTLPSMACSGGCEASVPATANTSIHLRWNYRNAQGASLATGTLVQKVE